MQILKVVFSIGFLFSFALWVYFAIRVWRGKDTAWKMWACVIYMWIFNMLIQIVGKFM